MFLTGRGKQGHLFDNAPKSGQAGSKELVRDGAQTISMLWNFMEPQVMVTHLFIVKEIWGL